MELEQNALDSWHNSELVDSKQSVNRDNPVDRTESDKEQSEEDNNMKRDIVLRSGDNSPMDFSHEQSKQKLANQNGTVCESTSNQEDSSREDSFSDCSENEESSQCQLTNQALRAKLINSVINPISDRDSKLRVSVFDHRIIPKKFIIPAKSADCRNHVDTTDNDNVKTLTQTKSQDNINELNCSNNRRKVSSLPYTSLTGNRTQSNTKDSNCDSNSTSENGLKNRDSNCSENGSKMETDFEIRTRFDILLRNLIGDVDSINVQPSPMTVSSGYESDYMQTHNIQNGEHMNAKNEGNKTHNSGNTDNNDTVKSEDTPTDYFTMSETYPQTQVIENTGATQNQQFSSLPSFPTQYMDSNTGPVNSMEPKDVQNSKPNTSKQTDSDFGFFYKQKKNYKLTKVTRSMYEIIHDLQNGEKGQSEGKKRSRKGRRPGQDSGSDGTNSPRDTLTRGRPQVGEDKSDNNTDSSTLKRTKETNNSCVSGSVVRCVRRPKLADSSVPRPVHRRFSQSENEVRLGPAGAINSDKVQNDLRNLLCDTSDVTASSASINARLEGFTMLSSSPNTRDGCATGLTSTGDNGGNHSRVSINGEENRLTEGKRKPTLNEKQFNNGPKHDDHVYETIPGDEKFYEEWKKMRTAMPCIRRFTTIPDLPGTFIPKEPPALPARKYLNNANQGNVSKKRELSDSNDNYIVMGDINSNFPTPGKSDSGYTTVSSDQMPVLRETQCFPYPGNTSPSDNFGRHDETSDGYCSIDNLSLIREPVDPSAVTQFTSNERTRDWRVPEPGSVPPPPRLKRSDFFMNPNQQQFIQNGFSLFNHEHSTDIVRSPEVLDRRRSRDAIEDINCMSSNFDQRTPKQSFQATYV